jgi:hypothetical protein
LGDARRGAVPPTVPTVLSDAKLLARLVGFDSTSRNSNLPIADFLCDYLDQPGVRIARDLVTAPAEWLAKSELATAHDLLGRTIRHFCAEPG